MLPLTSYARDNHLRVVLQGPPKSGKSCLAMQFPRPYFIDLDLNLGGPLRWAERTGAALPVGYNVIDRDENGAVVPEKLRYQWLYKLLIEAGKRDDLDTIVIDSATNLAGVIEQEVLRSQNKNSVEDYKDGRQFWGFFFNVGKHFMATLMSIRKNVVLTAHEKINKLPDGSIVYPIKLAWPGQLGQIIGAFFTDVWRCETKATPSGLDTKYEWLVRTMPDAKYELGNSLGLPPLFKFDWKIIAEKLK